MGSYLCLVLLSLQQAKYMVDLEIQVPTPFDPFAEARESDAPGAKEYVHIRIQQRNGKKSLTTVQGLKKEFSYEKILKDLKKEFCCNGTVVQDKELGKIIQLQGDQRKNVSHFLVQAGLVRKDQIKIHDVMHGATITSAFEGTWHMVLVSPFPSAPPLLLTWLWKRQQQWRVEHGHVGQGQHCRVIRDVPLGVAIYKREAPFVSAAYVGTR
ncbi:Protein translation factor SUI1 2 [Glycine max]|nr:Protein translation factor SUI1 2 [Glycine max]